MEIKFFVVNNYVNEIDVSDVMLVYKIIELPADRNYYIEFYTADEQTSLQYLLLTSGFKNGGTDLLAYKEVWIHEKDPGFSLAMINSHTKKFLFTPGPSNEQWGYYKFNEVFELKPEYEGYLTGKEYGI